jgi:hypothetical protein
MVSENYLCPDDKFYSRSLEDYGFFIQQLYKNPMPLQQFLSASRDKRLGAYFEDLIAYWLLTGKRFRLIERHVKVEENGRTLGELDFIVHDLLLNRVLHWEVAVKFYLGCSVKGGRLHWLGPNLRDHLDKKITRLNTHQIPILHTPQARSLLESKSIHVDESWVLLKGRLFYPPQPVVSAQGEPIRNGRSDDNHWTTSHQFLETFGADNLEWVILEKNAWFSTLMGNDFHQKLSALDLVESLNRSDKKRPVCCVGLSDSVEKKRVFLVPDEWPRQASEICSRLS